MNISKEMVESRLERLRREKIEHEKLVLAYDGAIQEANYWLKTLDSEECSNTKPENS